MIDRFSQITLAELGEKAVKQAEAQRKLGLQKWLGLPRVNAGRKLTPEQATERFWVRVDMRDLENCWPFCGERTPLGYGVVRLPGSRVGMCASRLAFFLVFGPVDGVICHRCDNPACVNPKHLFAGTQSDNLNDCLVKNRASAARLTTDQVQQIRFLYKSGLTNQSEIARQFSVTSSTVHNIVQSKTWTTLKDN